LAHTLVLDLDLEVSELDLFYTFEVQDSPRRTGGNTMRLPSFPVLYLDILV